MKIVIHKIKMLMNSNFSNFYHNKTTIIIRSFYKNIYLLTPIKNIKINILKEKKSYSTWLLLHDVIEIK